MARKGDHLLFPCLIYCTFLVGPGSEGKGPGTQVARTRHKKNVYPMILGQFLRDFGGYRKVVRFLDSPEP